MKTLAKLAFTAVLFVLLFSSVNSLQAQSYDMQMYLMLKNNTQAFRDMMNANPTLTVNLRGADLSGLDLTRIRFSGSDLSYTNLNGASLKEANLKNTNMIGAKMLNTNLERAQLEGTVFDRANVTGANFTGANHGNANTYNMLIQIGNELFPAQIVNDRAVPLSK